MINLLLPIIVVEKYFFFMTLDTIFVVTMKSQTPSLVMSIIKG